ncbi:hypothetical protein ABFT23_14590 [Nocardioides sp. C4-1]|uniref:hypothetical protein n=1 Tax=Nocardioides sp. C4-1 TaxID=3151851 RepID=UPI0032678DD5
MSDETPDDHPDDHPDVGSVGEEAAKLLGALSEWARDSDAGAGLGATVAGLAGQAADAVHQAGEHIATGAPECTFCPVCRTVHVVRTASPEVKAQLATAASSFLQAVAGLLQTLPPTGGATPAPGSGLERIDLDGDDDE